MANLRTIKNKGKVYYYLEHTIREGSTFRNKRRYLGTTLPRDIDRIKAQYVYSIYEELYRGKLERIKAAFGKEFSLFPESAKRDYFESFMIRFTYNTNRIEGSTLTLKETADLLQESITPRNKPLRDVKEAEAHMKVFYDMIAYNGDLTLSAVLHWHKELFKESNPEIAGRIRVHHVSIARSKAQLALPAEIDTMLHDFFTWYNRDKRIINPVIMAALAHLKFVTIHPFSDGNGRMSRLMMNFVLHRNGYPMLNIDYSNRNAYYNALERSQVSHNDMSFVQYLVKRYLKEYGKSSG